MPAVEIGIANITDLTSVQDKPGWYGWIYVPSSANQRELSTLRQIQPEAKIDHYFHMSLRGRLSPLEITTEIPKLNTEEFALFQSLHFAFSPCLYIGISTRLKKRLHVHQKQVYEGLYLDLEDPEGDLDSKSLDTDKESAFFGHRVAKALRTCGGRAENLYVKYAISPTASSIKDMETLMNVSFGPILGRKP